jgi:hypothetical protein
MIPCFLCKRDFQFGPNRYAGRGIGAWNIRICDLCESMNHDGIVPHQHPELMAHLAQQGVTVQLNAKGWLPIPR